MQVYHHLNQVVAYVNLQERFSEVIVRAFHIRLGLARHPSTRHDAPPSRPERIPHDFQCLAAVKSFFEYMLAIPEDQFAFFTITQWTYMALCFVVLSRLTFAMASDLGWDSQTVRANIPMNMYVDCLCWRFQSLSTTVEVPGQSPRNPDGLYVMRKILETVKKSYSKRVAAIKPPEMDVDVDVAPMYTPHCPMKDPDMDSVFASYVAQNASEVYYSGSATTDSLPIYHDIWSTMTGSWANDFVESSTESSEY